LLQKNEESEKVIINIMLTDDDDEATIYEEHKIYFDLSQDAMDEYTRIVTELIKKNCKQKEEKP